MKGCGGVHKGCRRAWKEYTMGTEGFLWKGCEISIEWVWKGAKGCKRMMTTPQNLPGKPSLQIGHRNAPAKSAV